MTDEGRSENILKVTHKVVVFVLYFGTSEFLNSKVTELFIHLPAVKVELQHCAVQ